MSTPTRNRSKSRVKPTKRPVNNTKPCEPQPECDCGVEEFMFTPVEPLKNLLRKRDTLRSLEFELQHTLHKVQLELRLIKVKLTSGTDMLNGAVYNELPSCGIPCNKQPLSA